MGLPTNQAKVERAERRAMIALLAVFALLVQALIPALAMPAPGAAGEMLICTPIGLQTGPSDPGAPASAEHSCKHCLCPAPMADPPPQVSVQRVAYVVISAEPAPKPRRVTPPARAPPRPPGQGPPTSEA
ncbi:MAG: DUF2946 domain-containing protein [Alphaproteobacteria bacterium]|nr:DUF2946 domain-containing protein [Alphaproteobacteria bacterium]MBU2096076.1 DUF2946 domain-containing protein [Alphaproteobacteria bacterium]MBU2153218.1 DUF2946 domain-containing protein [Alphaproteobacteria bacterium]